MITPTPLRRRESGNVLFLAVFFSGILGIAVFSLVQMGSVRVQASHNRWDYHEAYFHAENAMTWAAQGLADGRVSIGRYSLDDDSISLDYYQSALASRETSLRNVWLTICAPTGGVANTYQVTSSAKVGSRVRTLRATVLINPPSKVFDYEYFLNNWGWWWGSSITGYGDNRANWDFDFRQSPTVNGNVIASGDLESDQKPIDVINGPVPLYGLAGANPLKYLHDGTERLTMPNLKDFTAYSAKATAERGRLLVGSNLVVDAVHVNALKPGLFIEGTAANPITINGPVVVSGDVVIKGVITGQGTLYVGGNLYVAGDVTYKNGPSFIAPPETMSPSDRDAWVLNARNANKDLVCFAVRETIIGGDVNSTEWKSRCFETAPFGLKWVGAEARLGPDGIANTPDDNVNYLDLNNDGVPDSAWYDADGDGRVDDYYSYENDLQVSLARAAKIDRYPSADGTNPDDFSTVANNNFNTLQGVFYCNHGAAMRSQKAGFKLTGTLVSRDEAIVFTSNASFVYDPRIHSRYNQDPNRFVDLGLPLATKVAIQGFHETAPIAGFGTP